MIKTDKHVLKTLFFYALFTTFLIFLLELLINKTYIYSISYVFGLICAFICFILISITVNVSLEKSKKRAFSYIFLSYIFRLALYCAFLYLVYKLFDIISVFFCFGGFLSVRISILIYYHFVEKIEDKVRKVDKLNIKESIKKKLKENKIYKTCDLTLKTREELLKFLENSEIEEIIKGLKEYELFLKGEIEVIKEDDDTF